MRCCFTATFLLEIIPYTTDLLQYLSNSLSHFFMITSVFVSTLYLLYFYFKSVLYLFHICLYLLYICIISVLYLLCICFVSALHLLCIRFISALYPLYICFIIPYSLTDHFQFTFLYKNRADALTCTALFLNKTFGYSKCTKSLFNGSDINTLNEVFLAERINNSEW